MRQSCLIILIIVIILAVRENLICTKSHIWDFVRQNGVTFVIIVIIIIIIITIIIVIINMRVSNF